TNIMPYTYSRPTAASFTGKGLLGYTFGPLDQKDLEIYYVEVEKGHDVFMISKKITRTYYVILGNGYFVIDKKRYDLSAGMLMEILPRVEYCYSGKMKLFVFSRSRWFNGNDTFTKWNPDVVQRDSPILEPDSWLTKVVRARILGKSPVNVYLWMNQRLW